MKVLIKTQHVYRMTLIFLFMGIMIALLYGCSTKPIEGLDEAHSNLLHFYSFYNTQYEDYMRLTANPETLSEAKKVILRKKKKVLIKLYRLIRLYEIQIVDDSLSSVETERMIYDLLNQIE